MDPLSPLPRSLDPLPGESLPGYLLRLAHRLGLAPARIMELTGLTARRDGRQAASRSLMLHLGEAPAGAFARVTRLTAAEVAGLCMSSMSGRYPWAAPQVTADQWGPRSLAGPWLFTSATRYCPQCLTGDGSDIQQQYGGAWQKAWRLPVVFACTVHRRLLEHLCPSCRQPAMSAAPGAPAWLIPRALDAGLHPAQCRAALQPRAVGRHARPCGARLDTLARDENHPLATGDLLTVQDRLLQMLNPGEPARTIMSVGQPTTPARYFADLRLVCSLLNGAWPHSQDLITTPGTAGDLDQYIASTSGTGPRRHTLCDTPPLDARPGAVLITVAARILDSNDLRGLGELLAPPRDGASRKAREAGGSAATSAPGTTAQADSGTPSNPLPAASSAPTGAHADAGHPPRRSPSLPSTSPNTCKTTGTTSTSATSTGTPGCSAAPPPSASSRWPQAARSPTRLPSTASATATSRHPPDQQPSPTTRQTSASRCTRSPGSSATPRPDQLPAPQGHPPRLVHRTGNLAGHHRPAPPDQRAVPARAQRLQAPVRLRGRLGASPRAQHLLAPRIIENQASRGDPTWHRRRDNMWHFYLATPTKPHYAALREILNAHVGRLAAMIDNRTERPSGP